MEKVNLDNQALLYPMPAVLVGVKVDEKPNFMTVAWCNFVAYKPLALSIAVQKSRYTLKGIKEKGAFSVNIPSVDLVRKVDYCGIYSGRKRDKSKIFQLFYGGLKDVPFIQECPVNLGCKEIRNVDIGSHLLIIGEIVETYVSKHCLTDGKADSEKIDPLVYTISSKQYHRMGPVIAKAFQIGKDRAIRDPLK